MVVEFPPPYPYLSVNYHFTELLPRSFISEHEFACMNKTISTTNIYRILEYITCVIYVILQTTHTPCTLYMCVRYAICIAMHFEIT